MLPASYMEGNACASVGERDVPLLVTDDAAVGRDELERLRLGAEAVEPLRLEEDARTDPDDGAVELTVREQDRASTSHVHDRIHLVGVQRDLAVRFDADTNGLRLPHFGTISERPDGDTLEARVRDGLGLGNTVHVNLHERDLRSIITLLYKAKNV